MSRRILIILFIAVVVIAAILLLPRDSNVVAVVGDWTLTTSEFEDMVAGRFGGPQRASQRTFEQHQEFLDKLVEDRLKIIDGYHKGIDTENNAQESYRSSLQREAITALFVHDIRDRIITEDRIRDFYEHSGEEVHASHILIHTDGRTPEEAEQIIRTVYEQASRPGAIFRDLAVQYNEDTTATDGDLGWFRWGIMVDEFQETAWEMRPGEISEPFQTIYGWHIIQLHGRRRIENRPSLEQSRNNIIRVLSDIYNEELRNAANEFIENGKEERNFRFHDENISRVLAIMSRASAGVDPFTMLTEDQRNLVLATLDDGGVQMTVQELNIRSRRLSPRRPRLTSVDEMKQIIEGVIATEYILPQLAEERGYFESEEVITAATATLDASVLQLSNQTFVYDRIEIDDDQLNNYYENHLEDYVSDPQFTLVEILVSDSVLAYQLALRIRRGENIRDLATEYSERRNATENNGVFGPITETQYGVIGRNAAEAEIGELVGPLKYSNKWSLFKVISKQEPSPQPLSVVENRVRSAIRRSMQDSIETAWIDSLRDVIPVRVNYRPLHRLFPDVEPIEPARTDG